MESYGLILDHQFGFRSKHAMIEQMHRIVKRINNDMETDRYCIMIFLDASSFDKVWHQGLFYKIKSGFPTDLHHKILFIIENF
jgi:hypothetical protein